MTTAELTNALQLAGMAAFAVIAALTIRDWLVNPERGRLYLALAIGSLAAVSILGQATRVVGPGLATVNTHLTIVLFLASGLALLLFRDSVIPLSARVRGLAIAGVAVVGLVEILVQDLAGRMAPKPLQLAALAAFVVAWCGCVGEPSVRLWIEARGRAAVQRARMRALSYGYLSIVGILVAAVFTAAVASNPWVKLVFAASGLAIAPLLYAGFVPPTWLRRLWRQREESRLQAATQDIVLFAPDEHTFASRALEWAVRLTGADAGYFVDARDIVIATRGMTASEAASLRQSVSSPSPRVGEGRSVSSPSPLVGEGRGGGSVVPLGGRPPRNAIVVPIPGSQASIVLIGGPFTPIFGTDEQAWIGQYASLIGTGLERVRLVEAVERMNGALQARVDEVTQRTRELEEANRELEAYSYTISHDLRAPLRAINGFTSILLEEYAESIPEEARGYLVRVRDNGIHMGRLVDDLLSFSRLGRQALRKQRIDTRSVVDRVVTMLEPSFETRKVELVVNDLPDCEADPSLLEQVFVNLLGNAVKYSQKREAARIEVGSFTNAGDDEPTYFVRDNGAGFDMAYADKLFGVFQRLHTSRDYEGTGVGLAIVKRIIDRHGGRIWADARVDQGATFYFTLGGAQEWQTTKAA